MLYKSIDVSGVWTGLCRYDSAAESVSIFPADFRGVPFELTLRHGWFGRLTGEIRDDPKFSDPEPARVRGSVRNAILDFFMTRRNSSVMFEGRIVPLSEYVRTHWNADIEWSSPHPVAKYRGELNADGKRISGVWWIAASTTLVRIKGIIYLRVAQVPGNFRDVGSNPQVSRSLQVGRLDERPIRSGTFAECPACVVDR